MVGYYILQNWIKVIIENDDEAAENMARECRHWEFMFASVKNDLKEFDQEDFLALL